MKLLMYLILFWGYLIMWSRNGYKLDFIKEWFDQWFNSQIIFLEFINTESLIFLVLYLYVLYICILIFVLAILDLFLFYIWKPIWFYIKKYKKQLIIFFFIALVLYILYIILYILYLYYK